ncbi:YHYH protein [Nitratireductor sp. XY-223]|uniref:YHYH protein n=1 Tax=Nitratireductor sp. XY-223 TaxID=2561926 RepID=UPI0010AB3DC9|nr:YHYH protein [Nitratireductor sp. XY-223]
MPRYSTPMAVATAAAVFLFSASASLAQDAEEILRAVESDPDSVDMTDVILTGTSPDCADYAQSSISEANDLQQNRTFTGAVIVSVEDGACTVTSNGIPNHSFGGGSKRPFATPIAAIGKRFDIPRSPKAAGAPTALSHGRYEAILLNGVVIDILSAGCYNPDGRRADRNGNVLAGCAANDPWLIDPMSPLATFAEDDHHGHTQPDGRYHYHGNPMALFDDDPGPDGSPLIGFAADGFPVYGSYFKDADGTVRKAVSGYALRSGERPSGAGNPGGAYDGLYRADYEFTGEGDLDECNGMTVNGSYGYYVIDAFPWAIACLKGTPDRSFSAGRR